MVSKRNSKNEANVQSGVSESNLKKAEEIVRMREGEFVDQLKTWAFLRM